MCMFNGKKFMKSGALYLSLGLLLPISTQATVVTIQTVLGDIEVNLFDSTTPATVENFLSYVNSGAYANNVVHRVETNFVVQGGGFQYNNAFPLDSVATGSPVVNEPKLSNVRGTIAMAKVGGQANSATSQWFINLANNSAGGASLDTQNKGFTVFGQVLGDGMQVVDAIAAVSRFNMGGAATSIPLRNYTTADASSGVEITDENLVLITDIIVTDFAVNTHPEIIPVANTLINSTSDVGSNGSSGGGSMGWLLGLLIGIGLIRRRK
jgi:peptidyl-prolyl cis-trans isomerase A (cyclophilin A)